MNPIQGWLTIIGTKERASKLRKLLNRLNTAKYEDVLVIGRSGLPEMYLHQRVPAMCPTVILNGDVESRKMYLNPDFRPALDAWDSGEIDSNMLRKLCLEIESGRIK